MTLPGGNPVIAVPGLTPRSPVRTVAPVFVTVDPPRTANDAAVPKLTLCAVIRKGNARLQATLNRSLMVIVKFLIRDRLESIVIVKKKVVTRLGVSLMRREQMRDCLGYAF
jgi:hypothetical protein